MRYGERLKKARTERKLTQTQLAERAKVNQSLISQLENSPTATGSEYTNRLARALDINADWLADEIGEMTGGFYATSDPKLIAAIRVMEEMPEYARDEAIKGVTAIQKLISRKNGTTGEAED